jgi:hypothetical protein
MADSANTFTSLLPLFKESYSSSPMSTHERPGDNSTRYTNKLNKLVQKPNSSKQYFAHIKKYVKKAKNGSKS